MQKQFGFTFLEMLVVIVLVGIIAAIVAPGWLRYLEEQKVVAGRNFLHSKMKDAQLQARTQSISFQFSVREHDDFIEWAIHPKSVSLHLVQWESLESASIQLDIETNFATSGDVSYVRFDERGNVEYRLGRLTLSSEHAPSVKRCIVVSTLIGATRTAKEQSEPRDGKLCY